MKIVISLCFVMHSKQLVLQNLEVARYLFALIQKNSLREDLNLITHTLATDRLYELHELKPLIYDQADGSIPLLQIDQISLGARCNTIAEYRLHANTMTFPSLKNFNMKGMVIAGDAVCQTLYKRPIYDINIIDLFFVGLSSQEAILKIHQLAAHLQHHIRNYKKLIVQRTNRSILFGYIDGRRKIQVRLRLFLHMSELLHSFDIGACAVADDGTNLYFTSLGKLAHERGINVLNLSYESQLTKYMFQGFKLALPEFDFVQFTCSGDRTLTFPTWKSMKIQIKNDYSRQNLVWTYEHALAQNKNNLTAFKKHHFTEESSWFHSSFQILLFNVHHIFKQDEKKTSSNLVAYALYSSGLDVTTIQPQFDNIMEYLYTCFSTQFFSTSINEIKLFSLLSNVFEQKDTKTKLENIKDRNDVVFLAEEISKLIETKCTYFPFKISLMGQDIDYNNVS